MTEKIVYLLGAGASHAEKLFSHLTLNGTSSKMNEKESLLTKHLSKTVFWNVAKGRIPSFLNPYTNPNRELNIEHYISMVSTNQKKEAQTFAIKLKEEFATVIKENLKINGEYFEPTLTGALIELHTKTSALEKEKLNGFITLNYDPLLDKAFEKVTGKKCYYGFLPDKSNESDVNCPILKLHGSFNWKQTFPIQIKNNLDESFENIWIPPGINKDYLSYPHSLIWGKAREILNCNKLRVIGCSLDQNDWSLLCLLLNANIDSSNEDYKIELILPDEEGQEIRERLGMFPSIEEISQIEERYFSTLQQGSDNIFYDWLKMKADKMLPNKEEINGTYYLKRILE